MLVSMETGFDFFAELDVALAFAFTPELQLSDDFLDEPKTTKTAGLLLEKAHLVFTDILHLTAYPLATVTLAL